MCFATFSDSEYCPYVAVSCHYHLNDFYLMGIFSSWYSSAHKQGSLQTPRPYTLVYFHVQLVPAAIRVFLPLFVLQVFSCSLASFRTFFWISCSIWAVPILSSSLDSFRAIALTDCRTFVSWAMDIAEK